MTAETKPKPAELKLIIKAAGGTVLDKAPTASTGAGAIIVTTEEERKAWAPLLAKLKGQARAIKAEHLLTCVLQQRLVIGKEHSLG